MSERAEMCKIVEDTQSTLTGHEYLGAILAFFSKFERDYAQDTDQVLWRQTKATTSSVSSRTER